MTELLGGLLVAAGGIQTELRVCVPGSDIGRVKLECALEFMLSAG